MKMKKLVGLFTVLAFASVVLSASPVSAGIPYCWFNKWIRDGCTWVEAPTTVTVPMGTDVHWRFRITVALPSGWGGPIENVVVKDRFGAEIEIDDYIYITDGDWTKLDITTNGESEKVFLTWEIGTLSPGDTATLILEISTDHNPADHQEYTSPGCYELNSGAVLKFTYEGKQYSAYTLPITVLVEED